MYKKYLALLALVLSFNAFAQSSLWSELTSKHQISLTSEIPRESLQFQLQDDALLQRLSKAPSRLEQRHSNVVMDLPNDDGTFDSYQIFEASNFHPDLAAKYPEIKSYVAKGLTIDATAHISYAPSSGLSVAISNFNAPTILIKKLKATNNIYSVFSRASIAEEVSEFECETIETTKNSFQQDPNLNKNADDSNLRLYRAAIATTGEFSQFFLDGTETTDAERKAKVLAAINLSLTRINGIFERDFSVTMQLIPNNDVLIYLNASTDPFNVSNFAIQNTIDTEIGDANYDVGHLFAYEGSIYGNAGCIACVCTPGSKGQAFTVHSAPDSDNFNMIASHEYGHQFGGWHVQSSANCRSSAGLQEVEPGSGSTIMGYAGICSPNVQSGPDDYFNYVDIRDVAQWTINDSSCAELIGLSNNAPTANAGNDFTIPRSTAFVLEGEGSDTDNDAISFCWEENDPENPNSTQTPQPTWVFGPMFRSKLPVATPDRYMPQLSDVVAGNLTATWEMLPSVSRTMDFVLTVRDNALNGGQTASDEMTVTVTDAAGPFVVTSQATPESWNVGEDATVTWDVANTNVAPVNATQVDIYLSVDGGYTYPYPLVLGVDNDGSETINLPNLPTTTQARVMVRGANSIFYAINASNIEIQASEFVMNFDDSVAVVCKPNEAVYNFTYNTFLDFNETTTFSAVNLPAGAQATFTPSNATDDNTAVVLTISNTNAVANGIYDFTVNGLSATAEKNTNISLEVYDANLVAPSLQYPENNATAVGISETFTWQNNDNAASYEINIATDAAFNTIVLTDTTEDSFYDVSNLEYNTTYYWRVAMSNECGTSAYSAVNEFITFCVAPTNVFVDNVITNAANLNWTENGNATSWEVEVLETGVTPSGTGVVTTTNPYALSDLTLSTAYDVYVRSVCGGSNYSDWSDPISFSTIGIEPPGLLTAAITDEAQGEVTLNWSEPSDFVGSWLIFYDFDCIENWFQTEFIFNEDQTFSVPEFDLFGTWTLTGDQIVFTFDNGFSYFGTRTGDFMEGTNDADGCWEGTKINTNDPIEYTIGLLDVLGQPTTNPNQLVSTTATTTATSSALSLLEYNLYRDAQLIATTTEITYVDTLPDYGSYQYYVTAVYDEGESESSNIETVDWISCPEPTVFVADNITTSSADLNWISNGVETAWEIEYGAPGYTPGTGTSVLATTNPFTLSDLTYSTTYDVYLRANCGANPGEDDSNWVGPLTIATQDLVAPGILIAELTNQNLGEVTLNWSEPSAIVGTWLNYFDHGCTDSYNLDEVVFNEDGTFESITFNNGGTWVLEGNQLTYTFDSGFQYFGTVEGTFVSGMTSSGGCWYGNKVTGNNYIEYTTGTITNTNEVNPNPNETMSVASSALSFVEYNVYRDDQIIASTVETTYLDTLPDYGIYDYYVTAVYDEGESAASNIETVEWISCPEPTAFIAENITTSSADLSWISNGVETAWEIEYGAPGFTPGTGTLVAATTNPFTLSGLSFSTTYDVYLRANCGANPGDDDSIWVGPISIATLNLDSPGNLVAQLTNEPQGEVTLSWGQPTGIIGTWLFNFDGSCTENYSQVELIIYDDNTFYFTDFGDGGTWELVGDQITLDYLNGFLIIGTVNGNYMSGTYDGGGCWFADKISGNNYVSYTVPQVSVSGQELPNSGQTSTASFSTLDLLEYYVYRDAQLIASTIETTYVDTLPDYGVYNYYVTAVYDQGESMPSNIETVEWLSCPEPSNLVATNTTADSADLSWLSGGAETAWEMEYGLAGFAQGTGTVVQISTNPFTLTGLNSSTNYEVYLRANCGVNPGEDDSFWTGPVAFTTLADFCNGDHFYDSGGANGNYQNGEDITTVITPSEGFNTVTVTFNSFQLEGCCDYLSVYDGLDTNAPFLGQYNGTSIPESFTSSNPSGALTFRFTSDGSVTYSGWDATVSCELITCPDPEAMLVNNITQSSVDVSWIAGGTETSWELEYGISGFTIGTGTVVQTASNPYTLAGLEVLTPYDVYLRANCGASPGEDDSNWIGPISFTTLDLVAPGILTAELTNQEQGEVTLTWGASNGIVGTWINYFDHGCTDSYNLDEVVFNEDGTFESITFNNGGTWVLEGDQLTYTFDSGFQYFGTVEGTYVSGMTSAGGCWYGNKATGNNYIEFTTGDLTNTNEVNPNPNEVIIVNPIALDFIEYNIYRNNQLIASTTETTHADTLTSYGIYEYYVAAVYDEGESEHSNIEIVEWESLSLESNTLNGLKLYPNPVNSILNIDYTQNLSQIEVFTILGQKVMSLQVDKAATNIDMTVLEAGTYFVKVWVNNRSKVFKIIKE